MKLEENKIEAILREEANCTNFFKTR